MASRKPVGKKKRTVTVDLSGVESGGGRAVPEGNYTVECTSCEEEESSSGNEMLVFKWKITSAGAGKGATIYDNVSLQPQALWRLKTLLECLGIEDLDSTVDLELDELVGQSIDVEITNETYEGKQRPRITAFLGEEGTGDKDPDETETEEEEEEAPKVKGKKKTATKPDDDEEEEAPKSKKKVSKMRVGAKVTFEDEDGKTQKGTLTALEGDTATVDVKGEEWELSVDELTVA